jgi:hypothetical protein
VDPGQVPLLLVELRDELRRAEQVGQADASSDVSGSSAR